MNAFEQMQLFNRNFRGDTKATYKAMQAWYRAKKPTDGVFCPSKELFGMSPELLKEVKAAIAQLQQNSDAQTSQMINATQMQFGLHLFGTWRNSLGIYRIDEDVLVDLAKALIPEDTPSHIFSRLPDWCVYIEMPDELGASDKGDQFLGFWALLDRKMVAVDNDILVLHLVPHFIRSGQSEFEDYMPIQMVLSEDLTVSEAISKIHNIDRNIVANLKMEGSDSSEDRQKTMMRMMLPLLLWLCAEEPDISNINGEPISSAALRMPKYGVNKKTGAFVPPNQPIIYNLGKRLGGEIRQFNLKNKDGKVDSGLPARKRPHIRRGHWHGVWRGTGQDKNFAIYWQPAIFVNGK